MAIILDGTNGITTPDLDSTGPITGTTGTFSGVIVAPDGTSSAPSITNDGDTNTGIYFPAADTIGFVCGGTEDFRIDSTGQLWNTVESEVGTDYTTLYKGYFCRAWVNFNGTSTVAIRASGNVSSITDNGTGDYTVNFTTALPDANYSISAVSSTTTSVGASITTVREANQGGTNPTTGLFRLSVRNPSFADVDMPYVFASVFR